MSALPVEPPEEEPTPDARTSDELIREMHGMLTEFHNWAQEFVPVVRLMSEELKKGGIMGLMGAMMGGKRG